MWHGAAGRFGSLVVVADGMGSRPHSRLGALAVCRAAHRAVRELAVPDMPDPAKLFVRIQAHWQREIAPREPVECSTTMLLSLVHPSGAVLMGQVGDGLIALATHQEIEPLVVDRTGFSNETDALGIDGRQPVWFSRQFSLPPPGFRILLATDGVSDDLQPERLGGLITYLRRAIEPLPPIEQHRRLCSELRAWPTPGHFDDKTLALHWSE